MNDGRLPAFFSRLISDFSVEERDILTTADGFFLVYRSLSNILAAKGILDFPNLSGARLDCSRFFDDWFLYAVSDEDDAVYSLLKLREQEHDTEDGTPADGDTPGVTVSFIPFSWEILSACLLNPTDENRQKLGLAIDRVVSSRGQRHHRALKNYFIDPRSEGAYLIADRYTRHIAALATDGCLEVPECYKQLLQRRISGRASSKYSRLPDFIDGLNREAGYTLCDGEKIYIRQSQQPTAHERLAILATHTGDVSAYCFAAEVEYHARFLTPLAKIKIPFFGRSIYDSAIRADMTIGDTEFEGPAPFHRPESKIVKRQYALHEDRQKEC